jgi:hypothetical protein
MYGPIILVQSGQHLTILRQGHLILYEDEFELATNLIHGPVDYQMGGCHIIQTPKWELLAQKVSLKDIDT